MHNQNFDNQFADKVARLCYEKFEKLPKSGKPVGNEWTHLAAIIEHCDGELKVISIATGSKCIGRNKLSPSGDVINDSHAEVLARRGFLKYLYEQIKCAKFKGMSNILTETDFGGKKYSLLRNVTFHLFASHVPCGDAAIFPKCIVQEITDAEDEKAVGEPLTKKLKIEKNIPASFEIGHIVADIHRTGAKCLPNETNSDEKRSGAGYHVVGCVRTKPGRGDPTLSVSCSDKILRWNCVGIQGALLSLLLEPVYLSSIIIGCPANLYSEEALRRAVIDRNAQVRKIRRCPTLLHSNLEFKFDRCLDRVSGKPAPAAIVWSNVLEKNHEVIVEGRRLGWTKKISSRVEPVSITKRMFLLTYKSVTENKYENFSYLDLKQEAIAYQEEWKVAKSAIGLWTQKSTDLMQFK